MVDATTTMLSSSTASLLDLAHGITSSLLYLTTCSVAIKELGAQISGTASYMQWNSVNGNYEAHCEYQEQQDREEAELKVWKERRVQAELQIVDCVAKLRMGRWLPPEILGMVGRYLREDDGLVLKKIW